MLDEGCDIEEIVDALVSCLPRQELRAFTHHTYGTGLQLVYTVAMTSLCAYLWHGAYIYDRKYLLCHGIGAAVHPLFTHHRDHHAVFALLYSTHPYARTRFAMSIPHVLASNAALLIHSPVNGHPQSVYMKSSSRMYACAYLSFNLVRIPL